MQGIAGGSWLQSLKTPCTSQDVPRTLFPQRKPWSTSAPRWLGPCDFQVALVVRSGWECTTSAEGLSRGCFLFRWNMNKLRRCQSVFRHVEFFRMHFMDLYGLLCQSSNYCQEAKIKTVATSPVKLVAMIIQPCILPGVLMWVGGRSVTCFFPLTIWPLIRLNASDDLRKSRHSSIEHWELPAMWSPLIPHFR
jgi:hypothetical protein